AFIRISFTGVNKSFPSLGARYWVEGKFVPSIISPTPIMVIVSILSSESLARAICRALELPIERSQKRNAGIKIFPAYLLISLNRFLSINQTIGYAAYSFQAPF